MVQHRVGQALDAVADPPLGHESVATLVRRMREARRHGEVVRMAELARELASVLGPRVQEESYGLAGVEEVLAEANGQFLADPSWPDRLIAATDLMCDRSADSATATASNRAKGGVLRERSR